MEYFFFFSLSLSPSDVGSLSEIFLIPMEQHALTGQNVGQRLLEDEENTDPIPPDSPLGVDFHAKEIPDHVEIPTQQV